MREQGVGLEHHVRGARLGGQVLHVLPVNQDLPSGWHFKPREHTQQGGFAATRPAQQAEQFVLLDV